LAPSTWYVNVLAVLPQFRNRRQGTQLLRLAEETGRALGKTASGADNGRPERAKVLALATARQIHAILVTELGRWGRSTQYLAQTLADLHGWKVSVLARTGLSFDLSTASGKLMRTIMAALARWPSSSAT
jgi:putative DNA-invertase from lambdoid prophage Rac